MSKVFLNGRFLSQRLTGVQRYAFETLMAMDALLDSGSHAGIELELLAPRGTELPRLQAIAARCVGRLSGHAWEQVSLPAAVGRAWLLCFGPTGPLLKRRQIVTMHDAATRAVPEAYSFGFRTLYNVLLPTLATRSPYLMTVSEFSRSELVRWFGARPESTFVSGEGWQHLHRFEADPSVLTAHGLEPGRFVLAVSSLAPHKNVGLLARVMPLLADTGLELVLVGAPNSDVFGAGELPPCSALKWVGYVSDAQLKALYGSALAFVQPSLYEGFGIPPLEAMACGCPVLASNAAALPEVCADAALYFSATDATQLARLVRRLLNEPALTELLRARARQVLARHSWKRAAAQHLELVQRALEDAASHEPADDPLGSATIQSSERTFSA